MEKHPKNEVTAFALKLLALRNHSRFELEEKLRKKGFGKEVTESALRWLSERKLIDDETFARELINAQARRKPEAIGAMRYRLLRRGVSEEIACRLLKELNNFELCYRAGKKKADRLKEGDKETGKRKLELFLRNRGFDWQSIQRTLSRLFEDEAEKRPGNEP